MKEKTKERLEYEIKYRKENKEKINSYAKIYREKHRQENIAYLKKYHTALRLKYKNLRCKICSDTISYSSKSGHCRKCNNRLSKKNPLTRLKSSISKLSEKNPNWVGDKIGRHAVHDWIKRRFPKPTLCQICKIKEPMDLANKSKTYNKKTYTRDLKNWSWLCRRCHMISDGRLRLFIKMAKQYKK